LIDRFRVYWHKSVQPSKNANQLVHAYNVRLLAGQVSRAEGDCTPSLRMPGTFFRFLSVVRPPRHPHSRTDASALALTQYRLRRRHRTTHAHNCVHILVGVD